MSFVVQADDAGQPLLARLLVPAPLPVLALAGTITVVHGKAPGALIQRIQTFLRTALAAASEFLEVGRLAGQLPARPVHHHGPASPVSEVAAADVAALAVEVLAAEARELDAAALAQVLLIGVLRRFPGTRSRHCRV